MSLLLLGAAPSLAADVNAAYLFNLSDFDGIIPYNAARTFVDEARGEVYVSTSGGLDIYNPSGMLTFHVDYDRELGGVYDAALDDSGNILLLTNKKGDYGIVTCNYRGEPLSSVPLRHVPPDFAEARPGRMIVRHGEIYLVDQGGMFVVVVDADGEFIRGYDLGAMMRVSDDHRPDAGLGGFTVDRDGHMLFVASSYGKACRGTLDGELAVFGKRGSSAGKFGVPGGIASDRNGNLLITDKLRAVIMIYNKEFQFVKEFGYRGTQPGNVIVPSEITVDPVRNRVYVSQMRRRGVNIYQLSYGD
ncbi:NHL repeat domain protein [Citrifermentans bremense]|uniref:NHL repeat domain protein n=1 Tax=Citrifermentans bremense TaxID=60035 RepID=A0A7R7FTS1_9BACT|nr:NHL repeat domain protein [Citrifermentans bremense]